MMEFSWTQPHPQPGAPSAHSKLEPTHVTLDKLQKLNKKQNDKDQQSKTWAALNHRPNQMKKEQSPEDYSLLESSFTRARHKGGSLEGSLATHLEQLEDDTAASTETRRLGKRMLGSQLSIRNMEALPNA